MSEHRETPRLTADKHFSLCFWKKKGAPTSPTCSQITVSLDCGFGNSLFIRGDGAQLSWNRGMPLENVGTDHWQWKNAVPFEQCQFKLLLNDVQYELGPNRQLRFGENLEIFPEF